jgi:hypothetical protein
MKGEIIVLYFGKQISYAEYEEILNIRNILMKSNSVYCDEEIHSIVETENNKHSFPVGYNIQIDFNKLAMAIYNAGYRKEKTNESV